jgi:hypothetical protein
MFIRVLKEGTESNISASVVGGGGYYSQQYRWELPSFRIVGVGDVMRLQLVGSGRTIHYTK